jgi:hypothetical protein
VSTAISILAGVGLFLLGMTVMTDGLKGLAGSALRTVLDRAAATPLRGAWWGATCKRRAGIRDANEQGFQVSGRPNPKLDYTPPIQFKSQPDIC